MTDLPCNEIYRFKIKGDDRELASMTVFDRRLDSAIHHALHQSPDILFDRDTGFYIVDIAGTNPPHLHPTPRLGAIGTDEERYNAILLRRAERAMNPPLRVPPSFVNWHKAPDAGDPDLNNPLWISDQGWSLSYVVERPKGLKRGERGKHWRLDCDGFAKSIYYKSKQWATLAIKSGQATLEFAEPLETVP